MPTRSRNRTASRLACVVSVTVAVLLALAGQAQAAKGLGPPPVPCSPAPCDQPAHPITTGPGGRLVLARSSLIHLAITPHVAHIGQIVNMNISYSGAGHCLTKEGSSCGPQISDDRLLAINCATRKPLPNPPTNPSVVDATSQCFRVRNSSNGVVAPPFYEVISALAGECSVDDCVSDDYLVIASNLFNLSGTILDNRATPTAPLPGDKVVETETHPRPHRRGRKAGPARATVPDRSPHDGAPTTGHLRSRRTARQQPRAG